jgi:DNA-binding transcriptional LysR family regulator
LRADKLFDDALTPLAGRAYRHKLKVPADLLTVPLIDTTGDLDWPLWLRSAGIRKPVRPAIIFDSTKIAVDAAMEGSGVAIGPPFLFADQIAAQKIFQPFELVVRNGKAWWVVSPESRAEQTKTRAFRDWLLAEAGADAHRLKGGIS